MRRRATPPASGAARTMQQSGKAAIPAGSANRPAAPPPSRTPHSGACDGRSSNRQCWMPCTKPLPAARRPPARRSAPRRHRKNSRPGFRSPRGRNPGFVPGVGIAANDHREPRGVLPTSPSIAAGGDRAHIPHVPVYRLRCAIMVLAARISRTAPRKCPSQPTSTNTQATPTAAPSNRQPGRRHLAGCARFRGCRSRGLSVTVQPAKTGIAIQVTGWPIAR